MRPGGASIAIALLVSAVSCTDCAGQTTSPKTPRPVVRADEHQNDKTVTLRKDQRLQVVLHSTYWQFQGSSDGAVLRPDGRPRVRPTRGCVAGAGCGTVTAVYLAAGAGSATVRAGRTSCGEALGCTPAAGRYTLRVRVIAP